MPRDPRDETYVPSQVFDLDKEEANRVINDLFSQLEMHVKASREVMSEFSSVSPKLEFTHKAEQNMLMYLRMQLGLEDWRDV